MSTRPLRITVGDEEQGTYATLPDALASLLLLQLALPGDIQCRFGLGVGPVRTIEVSGGAIDDGPGWWAAREAIDTVHRKQQRAAPRARTWVAAAPGADALMQSTVSVANAYLLARDEVVGGMSERTRRLRVWTVPSGHTA
jgi:hypothetical protein